MKLNPKDRISLVKSYIGKAGARLQDAKEFAAGHPGISARVAYDAAYYSAVAMFLAYGQEVPKTHEGINRSLENNFVRNAGIFPARVADSLGHLERDRNIDQYSISQEITKEQATIDVKKAEIFFETAGHIVKNRLEYLETHAKDISAPDWEDKVLALNFLPDPQIYSTPSNLVNYRGPILHADSEEGFSVQQTGKNILVIHKHEALPRIPEKGENLQINYKPGGKAEIKALRDRNKNTVTGRR